MFIIELTYKAPLTAIDAHMADHVAFLNRYYASGNFLISGRQIPRAGGIIVAVANSRGELDGIAREDPFVDRGLAEFRIVEFRASQHAAEIDVRVAADIRRMATTRRPAR